MDVTTIAMPKAKAKEALEQYRDALKAHRSEEDEYIADAYRELARGRNLLNIQDALAAAGVDEAGLPKLAIARSDAQWCYLAWSSRSGTDQTVEWFSFGADQNPEWTRRRADRVAWLKVPEGVAAHPWIERGHLRTQVPIVPPLLRPRGHLSRFYTLFEVEEWARVPSPPRDPALLKRIRGDMFAVLATWDLTEVERMAIGTRR